MGELVLDEGFHHFYPLIQAARCGLGIADVPRMLVQDDLNSGTLVAPFGFVPRAQQVDDLSTRPEINVNFGEQNRMRCKAASAPQCEHCKQEPTQQRAGYGSQKHIYLRVST